MSAAATAPAGATRMVRIGGASGFWGDSAVGAPQLAAAGVDYIVFDYLAELTLSILAAARRKNPELGYATDFVTMAVPSVLDAVASGRVRLVSNAGGLNPQGCARAIEALAASRGVTLRVAVVDGDDVMPLVPALRGQGVAEMQSGAPLPAALVTANAYLGALPVRAALDAGAQIVVTGRCVDSAVTLGVLMHEFGWAADDWDRLAQGSLAGHIIECGCQATGGLHTDWQQVPDWPHIGYPILECQPDGGFTVTKPAGTGGLVSPATVGEQLLYEIGDPRRYLLPDVSCDFTGVTLTAEGTDRVAVQGARGSPPGPQYKVSATWLDGWRCTAQLTIVGFEAAAKARRTGEAILARTRGMFAARGWGDYSRTLIEVLGSEEASFGPHARCGATREAVLHLAVMHPQKEALELFAREIAPAGTSWSPGTTGASGRPSPSPCIRQFAFLLDKSLLSPCVRIGDACLPVAVPTGQTPLDEPPPQPSGPAGDLAAPDLVERPLIALAWARSGDKGDSSNIGVIARRPEWLPWIRASLTEEAVAQWLGHRVLGRVTRYEVPGIHALNFLCAQALGGGGMASLRNDPLGKGMAQVLLAMPVRVPPDVMSEIGT